MKNIAITIFLHAMVALFVMSGPTLAADCNSAASDAAENTGGEVLNVIASQEGGQSVCTITIRVPGENNQPPRVVTRVVKQ